MEDGKRKIWLCLLILVLAAVVAGLAWYLSDAQAPSGEGFLIGQQAEEGVVCRVI